MKRIIILEGPDACGKSTLAHDVAKRLQPSTLVHHGPYKGEQMIWQHYLFSMLPAYADLCHVVLDRAWISEPIYGEAYRNGVNRVTVAQRRMLERVALGRGAGLVFCRVPWNVAAPKFTERKKIGAEMLTDLSELRLVFRGYEESMREAFTPNVALFDYTSASTPTALAITEDLEAAPNTGPGIGAFATGSILLIGDRPGGLGGRWHLPFVSLTAGGCSEWLAEQLEEYDIHERALYWVNASDGVQTTRADFVDALKPRAVVALGDAAARWCTNVARVPFVQVDHPQHWKRFHHSESYPLIKELLKCLKKK